MKKKYDIAIVGVGVGANYGSVLTYFGLYKTLESYGYKPLLVSKIGAKANDIELTDTHAMRFAKEHYELSDIYNESTAYKLNDLADTFILGSDQVFNYGVSKNFGKAFYFDFVKDENKKISYASSFGHVVDFAPPEEVVKISRLFKRFNAISVRESSGVDLAKKIYGVPATQVSEPVFLLPEQTYRDLADRSEIDVSKPYLLAYILDPTPEKKKAIIALAEKLGLEIKIVLDGFPNLFEGNLVKTGMQENVVRDVDTYDFLKLYANSSYVFTDSFHGTSFALKFRKPFTTIGNKRRGMARFHSLFNLIKVKHCFTVDPLDVVSNIDKFVKPVNYNKVSAIIEEHVKASKQWLKNALALDAKDTIQTRLPLEPELPEFLSNNGAWGVDHMSDGVRLSIADNSVAIIGNYVWCDLASSLNAGETYQLKINWDVVSASQAVNLHIRNPKTGKFVVVGAIQLVKGENKNRLDTINFTPSKDGYSQVMLGAVHFTGINAGANIYSISVEKTKEKPTPRLPPKNKEQGSIAREFSNIDSDRFVQFYAEGRNPKGVDNARSLMMFYAHGFEKGLSRTSDFRPGFGNKSFIPFAKVMNNWLNNGGSDQDSFFKIACSVLGAYFDRHNSLSVDVTGFWGLFSNEVQHNIKTCEAKNGGAIDANLVREPVIVDSFEREFLEVVFSRRSIRSFTAKKVAHQSVEQAVKIAMQSPSVCNRQPVKVHAFDSKEAMKKVLPLQGGWGGYDMPPKLLLVTSDLSAYIGAVERNQAFIDGGLFMMSLLLGLENVGLGACCLNTAMKPQKEDTIRELLNIPASEVFISFIAIGHYEKDLPVPRSMRLPIDEVLVKHS